MPFSVAVVTAAQIEKARAQLTALTGLDRLDLQRPGGILA